MKKIRNAVIFCSTAFLFAACTNGNPNDHSELPKSTSSGSYSAGNQDSTSDVDPIPPLKTDTTAGQTNRMSNTASGASQPHTSDSNQNKK
jgi:hypothetical protein